MPEPRLPHENEHYPVPIEHKRRCIECNRRYSNSICNICKISLCYHPELGCAEAYHKFMLQQQGVIDVDVEDHDPPVFEPPPPARRGPIRIPVNGHERQVHRLMARIPNEILNGINRDLEAGVVRGILPVLGIRALPPPGQPIIIIRNARNV